jgi:Ni,Fe-hydrogenase III large subunit
VTVAAEHEIAGSVASLRDRVARHIGAGGRLADLFGTAHKTGLLITAQLAGPDGITTVDAILPAGQASYPAVTPVAGAAFWYEREIHDMFGVVPDGHPRLEPLVLPASGPELPRPGGDGAPGRIDPDPQVLPRHAVGPGLFTIPHGPVRSGVTESIEYLVETPGEDIAHLNMRLFYKHRGIEARYAGMRPADAVLLAERAEGIASVAHAIAFCQAVEQISGTPVPWRAALIRTLHAELERLACHLDVVVRLADGAGLAVATARFGWHKEQVLRLTGQVCGSRFGRGVVTPGGVTAAPQLDPAAILAALRQLERQLSADLKLLMGTASFLDRLRRTGPFPPARAAEHGALGPVGRASGIVDDARQSRPYAAYGSLGTTVSSRDDGDALARLEVRVDEIAGAFHLLRQAADELSEAASGPLHADRPGADFTSADGRAVSWAEAPQGEVLYDVRIESGRITRCRSRSASFHNLVLMHEVFAGDILTDFPFIEASFGLSVAGAAR